MGWRLDKSQDELQAFISEVFVENAPRYKKPSEWFSLWIDFWVALFDMSYVLGHVVGIGLPAYAAWRVVT